MKALTVHPRYAVFSVLETLVSNHRESAPSVLLSGFTDWTDNFGDNTALKSMGKEFLAGYLNIADGEKDPRNLLLAFAIDRVLLIEFDISSHVEVSVSIVIVWNGG
jgi:DNA repair/transcription protein MET18/MMS19